MLLLAREHEYQSKLKLELRGAAAAATALPPLLLPASRNGRAAPPLAVARSRRSNYHYNGGNVPLEVFYPTAMTLAKGWMNSGCVVVVCPPLPPDLSRPLSLPPFPLLDTRAPAAVSL